MSRQERLSNFFHVQPGERQMVSLIFILYWLLGAAFTFTQTAGYALFIDTFGPEGVPYTYLGIAVGVTLLSFTYLRVGDRVPLSRLLIINLSGLLVISMVLRLGLAMTQARWLIFILPIWDFAQLNLGKIIIWSLVGSLFDVRQSKRLFGLVSSGRWLAVFIVGLIIPVVVNLFGTSNLLVLSVVCLGLGMVILLRLVRLYPRALHHTSDEQETLPNLHAGNKLLKNPFIVILFVDAFIWMLAYFLGDNIYYIETARQYPDANQLASFLGLISAVIGALTLFSNMFLTSRVIGRYGVQVGILLTPLVVQTLIITFAAVGTLTQALSLMFGLAVLLKTVNSFFSEAFEVVSLRILVQPLPAPQRVRIATISDGIIEPLAIGVAGLLLVLLVDLLNFTSVQLAYVFAVVGLAWLIANWLLARGYRRVLTQAVTRQRLGGSIPLTIDQSTIRILKPFLEDKHPEAVIYTLDVMEHSDEIAALKQSLPRLLEHPSARVRSDALQRMERLNMRAALPAIRQLVSRENDVSVLEYALRVLPLLDEDQAFEVVARYLDAPDTPLRRGAMIGLLRSGSIKGVVAAGERLMHLVEGADTDSKELAAQILGEVGLAVHYQPVQTLLTSTNLRVRRAALKAAGRIKHPQLWPRVIQALEMPATRKQAAAALLDAGESALPAIRAALASTDLPRAVFTQLARTCGRIGGIQAAVVLEDYLDIADPELRLHILAALSACQYHSHDPAHIRAAIRAESQQYADLLAVLRDLGSGDSLSLLTSALQTLLRQNSERILYLQSFIHAPSIILRTRDALLADSSELRSIGLELLETTFDVSSRPFLMPIYEDLAPVARLNKLQATFPQQKLSRETRLLELLARPPTPWVNACAWFVVGKLTLQSARPLLPAALNSSDILVRETAQWAMNLLEKTIWRGEDIMLATIEKVVILKTVGIFAETPDDVLADVAAILEEEHYSNGEVIFKKGDLGNSLYLIVSGRVRVHDGNYTLNTLSDRQVFGEMALLDPAPRIATVTAVEDTHLFRLGQEAFYELMDSRGEVARGIIRVLTAYLRAWVDNADLRMLQQSMEKTVRLSRRDLQAARSQVEPK
ncbi:MAG: Npt1/Npt2 family nucleotide transporter [Anaerolineae bacterium]